MSNPKSEAGAGLAADVKRALRWSLLNTIVGRAGSMLAGIVLARVLAPHDYGVFAVGLVVLNALLSMNELGVSVVLVGWPGPVERVAPTAATVSVLSSLGMYGVCFVAAPVVANGLGAPSADWLLRVLTLGAVIDGLSATPVAVLTRSFRQERRMAADVTSFVVSTSLSLGLAFAGLGPWSLAIGRLVGNGVGTVMLFLLSPVKVRFGFDRNVARELVAFGIPLAGSSLLVFAMLNVDYVLVGSVLGPSALGVYLMAFNLSSWPVNVVSTTVRRVSLAGFSRVIGERDDPGAAFTMTMAILLTLAAPLVVLMSLLAPQIVGVVYGSRWSAAAEPLRFLAVLAGVRIVAELAYDFLVAVGRPRSVFALQGVWLAVLAPVLFIGARADGVRGVGIGHAGVAVLVVIPAVLVALRGASEPVGRLAAHLRRPAIGVVLAAGATELTRTLLGPTPVIQLAAAGGAGLVAYLAWVVPPFLRPPAVAAPSP